MNSITIEQVEFIYKALTEVADKVEISGLTYYVLPARIFDNGVSDLQAKLAAPSPNTGANDG